jgi:hypothetical protein
VAFFIKILKAFSWFRLLTECQRICDMSCSSCGFIWVTQPYEIFCLLVCVFMNTLAAFQQHFLQYARTSNWILRLLNILISFVPRVFLSTRYTHFKVLLSVSIFQLQTLQLDFVLRNIDFRIKIAHNPNTFLGPTLLEGIWATSTAERRLGVGRPITSFQAW